MKIFKGTALFLAICFLVVFAGCFPGMDPSVSPVVTGSPAITSPALTPTPDLSGEVLHTLDYKIFKENIQSSLFSYVNDIANPKNFPDIEKPTTLWGKLSYEDFLRDIETYIAYQSELSTINYESLDATDKLTYDTIKQYLSFKIEMKDYYYYEEYLSPFNGLHTMIPLNMAMFKIESKEDANDYMLLLEDVPRMINLILNFEKEKSEKGLFMRAASCDKVMSQIDDFVKTGKKCFLYETFNSALKKLTDITYDEKTVLTDRNDAAIKELFTSYKNLKEGLKELKKTGITGNGYSSLDLKAAAYFELKLKESASSDITVENAAMLLEDSINLTLTQMAILTADSPDLAAKYGTIDIALSDFDANMTELKKTMESGYPDVAAHTYSFVEIPEALKGQLSVAAYLTPPIDEYTDNNVILINSEMLKENKNTLLTLAHEAYAGHMYQIVYQRGLTTTGYLRKQIGLTAYYEGWSTTAEEYFAENTTAINSKYCVMMNIDSAFSNMLLPAYISLLVYAYGMDEESIAEMFVDTLGEKQSKTIVKTLVDIVNQDPFYILDYAMGYVQLSKLRNDASDALSDKFDLKAFNEFILDLGPTYYNLISPLSDKWVSEHK